MTRSTEFPPETTPRRLESIFDDRGFLYEAQRSSWGTPPTKQVTLTQSKRGVLRGMHYHKKQWDTWTFVQGSAQVQLIDLRPGDHFKWWQVFTVGSPTTIIIPPGVAHGWLALSDGATLVYGLSEEYDRENPDEYGFNALDPQYQGGAKWDLADIVRSDRDRNAKYLDQFLASL